jgi:hypothetical protein
VRVTGLFGHPAVEDAALDNLDISIWLADAVAFPRKYFQTFSEIFQRDLP